MWSIIKCEIGWKNQNTIRQGWCARDSEYSPISVWIEGENLAMHDDAGYYPDGCYEIPLGIIQELKEKNNE